MTSPLSLETLEACLGAQGATLQVPDLRSELLRTCVWALSDQGRIPVRTLRVTNLALSLYLLHFPELDPEEERAGLREGLDELGLVGDLTALAGGLWLPSPPRRVRLPFGQTDDLLVGGLPIRLLPRPFRSLLRAHGPTRRLQRGSSRVHAQFLQWLLDLGVEEESFEGWWGAPEETLAAWGQPVMASELTPFSEVSGAEVATRAYLPLPPRPGQRPTYQAARWGALPQGTVGARLLVRRERVAEFRDDFLVAEVDRGAMVRVSAPLQGGDQRRLMYYLDQLAQAPTQARMGPQQDRTLLVLSSELPPAELKLLSALGTLQPNDTGKYYPRRWLLRSADAELVRQGLENLGITLGPL